MVQEYTRDGPSAAPVVCMHCMSFFANPAFDNLCSQCYKLAKSADQLPAQPSQAPPTAPAPPSPRHDEPLVKTDVQPDAELTSAPESPKAEVTRTDVANSEVESVASPDSTAAAAGTEGEGEGEEREQRPKQKNPGKCWVGTCKKKVVFAKQVTNKCRCEYVFCDNHRQAETHNCDYDHKSAGRERLGKSSGPAVVADKVVRI